MDPLERASCYADGHADENYLCSSLLNEGTDVWRPVTAEPIAKAIYRIVSESTDPDNEEWVYRTGQEVAVEERVFVEGERGLVAVGPAAHARLDLTLEEVCIVQNALNEVCNALESSAQYSQPGCPKGCSPLILLMKRSNRW